MHFPFTQFEQAIDETILNRGLAYFRKGLVEEPEVLTPGVFEAIVQGSEPYRVTISIENDIVNDYSCTCPYDMGPVCKHVVALLFELQQKTLGIVRKQARSSHAGTEKPGKNVGRKTVAEQVDEIIKQLPPEVLADFIRGKCIGDPSFRRQFLAQFTHRLEGESKAVYAQQVKAILQSAKGRHGFIEWNQAGAVGKAVNDMLVNARKHLEQQHYQTALLISCAVLEEMVKALQFADDSDGDIGGCIEEAMEIIAQTTLVEIPEDIRKWLFDYAVTAFKKRLFEGWDWHMDILFMATEVMKEEKEAALLLKLIESMSYSEYDEERVQKMVLAILRKSGRHAEADSYQSEHIKNPSFREQAIRQAIEHGDLQQAGDLAREGIRQDQKEKPGLADTWVDWLLKIALVQKDQEAIIYNARYLFGKANRDHKQYYKILQKFVAPEKWKLFIDEMILEIYSRQRWDDSRLVAWICIQEERWKQLLEACSKNFTLRGIQEYETFLASRYPEEMAGLYKRGILELLDRHTGRNHYQEAARFIRRMKKLGAGKQADELIQYLQRTYPQRRALLEELERV